MATLYRQGVRKSNAELDSLTNTLGYRQMTGLLKIVSTQRAWQSDDLASSTCTWDIYIRGKKVVRNFATGKSLTCYYARCRPK